MKINFDINFIKNLVYFFIMGSIVLLLFLGTNSLDRSQTVKEDRNVEEVIRKALVQCYALEGSYPSQIEYLTKYGIIFDNEKYLYHYEPFGEDIPVVKLVRLNEKDYDVEF